MSHNISNSTSNPPIEDSRVTVIWSAFSLLVLVTGTVAAIGLHTKTSTGSAFDISLVASSASFATLCALILYGRKRTQYIKRIEAMSGAIVGYEQNAARLSKEAEDTALLMEQVSIHFNELFRKIPAPCFCYDSQGRFKEWNSAFEGLTLLEPVDLIDKPLVHIIGIDSDPHKMQAVITSVFDGESFEGIELQVASSTGYLKTILCNTFPLRGDGGKVTAAICAGVDITERIRLEERMLVHVEMLSAAQLQLQEKHDELVDASNKLELLAMCDSLTGLKNHRALQERLSAEFKRSARYSSPLSVLLVDVDKFKKYNDSYGHLAGDAVLREVAEVLSRSMRDTDFVARYGGEEFVVVLPHTGYLGALEAAERLRAAIEQAPWELIRVTASIGVSTIKPTMTHFTDLIAAADLALYYCKQHGRNQVFHAQHLPPPSPDSTGKPSSHPVDLDDSSTFAA